MNPVREILDGGRTDAADSVVPSKSAHLLGQEANLDGPERQQPGLGRTTGNDTGSILGRCGQDRPARIGTCTEPKKGRGPIDALALLRRQPERGDDSTLRVGGGLG